MTASKKGRLITDLDQSDTQIPIPEEKHHSSRVHHGKKHISKFSGNFPIRSRSAEWNPRKMQSSTDFQTLVSPTLFNAEMAELNNSCVLATGKGQANGELSSESSYALQVQQSIRQRE